MMTNGLVTTITSFVIQLVQPFFGYCGLDKSTYDGRSDVMQTMVVQMPNYREFDLIK